MICNYYIDIDKTDIQAIDTVWGNIFQLNN